VRGLPERLWTLRETAEFLAIPVGTLYKFNHQGTGPRFFRVGKHCRYDPRDVAAWLQGRAASVGFS
jgi:predicted DNA-binding transcriptional regulator AlpA